MYGYLDILNNFDLTKLLSEVLNKIPADKIQTLVDDKETKTN